MDILRCIRLEEFKEGEVVVRQGERGDKFYIIIEGQAAVYSNNEAKAAAVREYQLAGAEEQQDLLEELAGAQEQPEPGATPARPPSARGEALPRGSPRLSVASAGGGGLAVAVGGQGGERFAKGSARGDGTGPTTSRAASQHLAGSTLQPPDGARGEPATRTVVLTEVGLLHQGDAFGELALRRPTSTRQATVICAAACRFAVLTRAEYARTLASAQAAAEAKDARIAFLQSIPLFAKWSRAMLVAAARHCITPYRYHRGKIVLREGQPTEHVFVVRSGEVELSKRVRKGHSGKAPQEAYIAAEKVRVTDANHSIDRYNDQSLERANHCIEGDDSGIVGGAVGWNTGAVNEAVLDQRKTETRWAHEKRLLRQRRLSVGQTDQALARASTVGAHGFMILQSGQTFGEECMVIPELGGHSQYTARVVSEAAEVFAISELELARRLRQRPEALVQLRCATEDKARVVFRTLRRYPMWGLTHAGYAAFYQRVFYEQPSDGEDGGLYGASDHNRKVDAQARAFAMLEAYHDESEHANAHAKALAESMVVKNMSIAEMDHIRSLLELRPLAGGAMPQLEDKGRYRQAQRIVDPKPG